MRRLSRQVPILLLLAAATAAHADTAWRCVDANGNVAFQDRPCPPGSAASALRYENPPPAAAPAPPPAP
ncbi:MAG TPA: DUF4124 domain-containing protein, partial [Tahibacter sp.]|nr:DUF4124 domain-containing protein [Tahibacter sp.]